VNLKQYLGATLLIMAGGMLVSPRAIAASRIIEVTGKVFVKPEGISEYRAAGVGTELYLGDMIRPERGANVKVLCVNRDDTRDERPVPAGRASGLGAVCPDSVATRFNLRGRGEDIFLLFLRGEFVYETQVIEAAPILQWQAVPGATDYAVQVNQSDAKVWSQSVADTRIQYGGTALQEGGVYQVEVTAIGQAHGEASLLQLERLTIQERELVEMKIRQVESLDFSEEGMAIVRAMIYQEVGQGTEGRQQKPGLVMEAIAALEPVASSSHTPYVHRLLGDLYLQVGWLEQADAAYQRAIDVSALGQNRTEWTLAQFGLANIAAAKGNDAMAENQLRLAKVGYLLLGDTEQAELMSQRLAKLKL
jgi:hypothetical protein